MKKMKGNLRDIIDPSIQSARTYFTSGDENGRDGKKQN